MTTIHRLGPTTLSERRDAFVQTTRLAVAGLVAISPIGRGAAGLGVSVVKKGIQYTGKYTMALVSADPITQYGKVTAVDSYINKADFVYTTYQYLNYRDYQSPGNSSQVLPAGSARPGGTKPMLSQASINWNLKNGYSMAATTEHACGLGYRLKKVKGKWMCVRKTSKKSRSR